MTDLTNASADQFREIGDALQLKAYLAVRGKYMRETLEMGFGKETVARLERLIQERS